MRDLLLRDDKRNHRQSSGGEGIVGRDRVPARNEGPLSAGLVTTADNT